MAGWKSTTKWDTGSMFVFFPPPSLKREGWVSNGEPKQTTKGGSEMGYFKKLTVSYFIPTLYFQCLLCFIL